MHKKFTFSDTAKCDDVIKLRLDVVVAVLLNRISWDGICVSMSKL